MLKVIKSLLEGSPDKREINYKEATFYLRYFKSSQILEFHYIADIVDFFQKHKKVDTHYFKTLLEYETLVSRVENSEEVPVYGEAFRFHLHKVVEQSKKDYLVSRLMMADSVLKKGVSDQGQYLSGIEGLQTYINLSFKNIREGAGDDPGNINNANLESAVKKFEEDSNISADGLVFPPFKFLDESIGSFVPGDLYVHAGYTGEGKSTLARLMAYRNLMEGRNVVFYSLEMSSQEVLGCFFAIHSFFNADRLGIEPIPISNFLRVGLTPKQKEYLDILATDFLDNLKGSMEIRVYQPPYFDYEQLKSEVTLLSFPVHALFIDYVGLLDRDHQSDKEFLEYVYRNLKLFASSMNEGVGGVIIATHQINREGKKNAAKVGYYTPISMAGAAGVERNAVVLTTTYLDTDLRNNHRIRFECIKNRFGDSILKEIPDALAYGVCLEPDEVEELEDFSAKTATELFSI